MVCYFSKHFLKDHFLSKKSLRILPLLVFKSKLKLQYLIDALEAKVAKGGRLIISAHEWSKPVIVLRAKECES